MVKCLVGLQVVAITIAITIITGLEEEEVMDAVDIVDIVEVVEVDLIFVVIRAEEVMGIVEVTEVTTSEAIHKQRRVFFLCLKESGFSLHRDY